MNDPNVQRLYVAYSFLSYSGAELETPNSLPKPEHYLDKCYFNFEKSKCIMVRDCNRYRYYIKICYFRYQKKLVPGNPGNFRYSIKQHAKKLT